MDRDQLEPKHFASWLSWAKEHKLPLDFNATLFSHPKASGLTLASQDKGIRDFWIEHVKRCREIGAWFGRELGSPCVHNTWISDGMKDIPADRRKLRETLRESLDDILSVSYRTDELLDAVESKVFGIGTESFVVGSHEFYMGYAMSHNILLTLDMGHFHQGENVADKISSVLMYTPGILMHMSRGVRWDSDHVTIQNDDIMNVCQEIVNQGTDDLKKIHIGLDFFDGSINRLGAWVTGSRAVEKALLAALLTPRAQECQYEDSGKYFERLFTMEEAKSLPFGIVWDRFCDMQNVPRDNAIIGEVSAYEAAVTSKRS